MFSHFLLLTQNVSWKIRQVQEQEKRRNQNPPRIAWRKEGSPTSFVRRRSEPCEVDIGWPSGPSGRYALVLGRDLLETAGWEALQTEEGFCYCPMLWQPPGGSDTGLQLIDGFWAIGWGVGRSWKTLKSFQKSHLSSCLRSGIQWPKWKDWPGTLVPSPMRSGKELH